MGANDNDGSSENWPWNDKTFERMQAEHDKFMRETRDENRRLEAELEHSTGAPNTTSSPFTAFKRFVDDNLGVVTKSFRDLPSNVQQIRTSMQREQERQREEEEEISWKWTGSTDSPDFISMELARATPQEKDEAHTATVRLLSEAYERNQHVAAEKIKRLFEDPEGELGILDRLASPMLALGGAWFFTPEAGDRLPMPSDWRWPTPEPRWLSVNWFKRSAYSPIRLELHDDLGMDGAKWRQAFEDLLNAALDKPMSSKEAWGLRPPYGKLQSTRYGPGLDWMLSLQCRGILPPMLPRFWSRCTPVRDQPLRSLLQSLPWNSEQVPFGHGALYGADKVFNHPHDQLRFDFADLMTEIGTKSTSVTEAEREPPKCAALDDHKHQLMELEMVSKKRLLERREAEQREVEQDEAFGSETEQGDDFDPATEQALYDALYDAHDKKSSSSGHGALIDALKAKDLKATARVLCAWQSAPGDFEDRIAFRYEDLIRCKAQLDVLREALEQHMPRGRDIKQQLDGLVKEAGQSRWSELHDAYGALDEALMSADVKTVAQAFDIWLPLQQGDARALARVLSARQSAYGDVNDFLEPEYEMLSEAAANLSILREALRCHVPGGEEMVQRFEAHAQEASNLEEMVTGGKPAQIEEAPAPLEKPNILSALTTTHTTRLPDGTITTKVVLKQRFADGREETTESVHTTHEDLEQKHAPAEEKPVKKGWFWSVPR